MKYSQRNMVIRKMQTTDYTSVSSEFATYGAIKSLWINKNLMKVSVEITHGVRETLRSFQLQELYKFIEK